MAQELYARIHPDARNGSTLVRLYDVAGTQFVRGGGSYKGWYPINGDQAERLRRCHVLNGNPNSMRVFQIEEQAHVDEISSSEARSRMAPEQRRVDQARDVKMVALENQIKELAPLAVLLTDPVILDRLRELGALDKASSGKPLTVDEGDRVERVAAAPPRRPPMSELDIDDDRRPPAATQSQPPARTEVKPAPAPPARPGARPGAGAKDKKEDGKKDSKKEEAKPAASTPVDELPKSIPSDAHASADPSLLDEDDDSDV
jgi:hypothetical protein